MIKFIEVIKKEFLSLADFFISSDVWKKEPQVRRAYYYFFFSILLFAFITRFLPTALNAVNSPMGTQILRFVNILITSLMIILLVNLSFIHYRYLLVTEKDLDIGNLFLLYFISIFLFGNLYYNIYLFQPDLFSYVHAPYKPKPTLQSMGIEAQKAQFDFWLYSATNMITGNYGGISANSLRVSIIEYFQRLYSLFFIVLCFSIYIPRVILSKLKKKKTDES